MPLNDKLKDPDFISKALDDGVIDKSVEYGLKQQPKAFAETSKYAKQLNIPTDIAERKPDEIKRVARQREITDKIKDTEFVKKALGNPDFAAVAHNDVDALTKIERTVKAAGAGAFQATLGVSESILRTPQAARRWLEGMNEIGKKFLPEWMTAKVLPDPTLPITEGVSIGGRQIIAGTNQAADAINEGIKKLSQDPQTFGETFQRTMQKGVQADKAFSEAMGGNFEPLADVVTDPEAWAGFMGQAAPSLYLAYKSGGSIPFIAWLESMEVANDAAEFEKETGQKIDPVLFMQATAQAAAINTVLEKFGLDKVFGQQGKGVLSSTLKGALVEGGTEGLQQFNTNVAAMLSYNPEKDPTEGVLGSIMGGVGTGGPMGGLSALGRASGPNSEFSKNAIAAERSFTQKQMMDALVEDVKSTELHKVDPESTKTFLDEVLGTDNNVFINPEDAEVFFQSHPDVLENLPEETAEAIKDSMGLGADVVIPTSEYITYFTEYHEELSDILRNDQDGMSVKDAQEFSQEAMENLDKDIEKMFSEKQQLADFEQSAQKVGEDIKSQIIRTGRFKDDVAEKYAALHTAFAKTVARKTGKLPYEAYFEMGPDIKATPITGEKLDQEQRTKQRQQPVLKKEDEVWIYKEGEEGEREAFKGFVVDPGKEESIVSINDQWETIPNAQLDLVDDKLYQKERGFYQPEQNIIGLLEDADLSTFLHETGHFFLESMSRIPEFAEEMDQTLKWMMLDRATWDQMSLEDRREYHEQFARGFEAYLMEGKAPSLELQTVFQRFRDWLVNVYKSLRNLNVQLTPEVRQVFDRLLATDEQIREAGAARAYVPLFASYEDSGMTEKQWATYQRLDEERRQAAQEELQTRSLKDMKWMSNAKAKALREIQRDVKDKRAVIRKQVEEDVSRETVYRAIQFFRRGETINEKGELVVLENHRLDIDLLNEMFPYGQEMDIPDWKSLGYGKFGMLGKDGLDPEDVAHQFGYSSADLMIRDILEAPDKNGYINELVDQRMLETYGDISNPVEMERAAEEAIHNDVHTRFIHSELKALSKGQGNKNILAKAAKDYATQAINNKKIRDIKPNQYLAAQTRAGNNALKALGKGDRESAVDHKRAQVLNNHFYRVANAAQKDVDKMLRYLRKFQKEGTRKNLDPEYIEQIDNLLESFDYKNRSLKEIDKRTALAEFIKQQEEENSFQPVIDEALIEQTKNKNYKDMTYAELRGHVDTIEHIEHLGRLKKKLLTAKDQREFNQRMDEARLSLRLLANRKAKVRPTSSDVLGQVGDFTREYFAMHRKFSSVVREMDGGQDGGIMWQLLSRSMNESGDTEVEMRQKVTEELDGVFSELNIRSGALNLRSPKYVIPGTNLSLTDEQRIMVALNSGNEGNRQRLMDGGIIEDKQISQSQLQAILDTLTKKELDAVQKIFDILDSYRTQIGEQEKRLTGKTPKWVEATEIVTKNGTIKGGYFPAKYDVKLSERAAEYEALIDSRMGMREAFGVAATRHGYAKERASEVKGRPLLLNFNVVTRHLNEVIHRLSWQDWVTDANRSLKALRPEIVEHYGPEIFKELRETVNDVAKGETPARHAWETIINHLRVGTTIVGMGYRITTAAIQPTGFAQSWVRIGRPWLAKGLKTYLANPLKASKIASEKSKLMRDRDRTMMREMNEVLTKIRGNNQLNLVKAHAFWLIAKTQRTVDVPTWFGAYEKAMAQLEIETAVDQAQRDEIEAKAVAIADQAVIDSQSGGQIKDLARIQREGPLMKMFTNFYSYFSATWNLNVEAFRKLGLNKKQDPIKAYLEYTGDLIALNIAPAILAALIREGLRNDCEGDSECILEKIKEEQVDFLMGQTILTRELAPAARALTGGKNFGYQGPPGTRLFTEGYRLAQQVKQGEYDDAWRKALINTTGLILHLPTGQLNTIIDGFQAIENGEVEGAGTVLAPLAGPPRD